MTIKKITKTTQLEDMADLPILLVAQNSGFDPYYFGTGAYKGHSEIDCYGVVPQRGYFLLSDGTRTLNHPAFDETGFVRKSTLSLSDYQHFWTAFRIYGQVNERHRDADRVYYDQEWCVVENGQVVEKGWWTGLSILTQYWPPSTEHWTAD